MDTSESPVTVDVLVIGGSHAGLSAALTLYRAQHTCLIFDCQTPRNHYSTPVRLVSTWEHKDLDDVKTQSRAELESAGYVRFVDQRIEKVEKRADTTFVVTDASGKAWKGRKLLMATGARDVFPDLEGYADLYARGIFQCMFQFGFEQRGSESAGLLAIEGLANVFHASMLAEDGNKFAKHVTIYTDGNEELAKEINLANLSSSITTDTRKLKSLQQGPSSPSEVVVHFDDGSSTTEGFIIHRPNTEMDMTLIDQLGLPISDRGDIAVMQPFCQTSVSGVYAAGDCASPMKIIPNAISMGAYAACGIARELPRKVTGNPIVHVAEGIKAA